MQVKTEQALLLEEQGNETYVGQAKIGSSTSQAVWQIKKIVESGTLTQIKFADGNENYDNIWDNRASLSYS